LVGGEETETAVCEATADDDSAEPEVHVGEPAAVGGSIADEAVVVVGSEAGLDDDCCYDPDAEEVI